MIYRFRRFELDEEARQLWQGREQIVLQPLVFDLLVLLLRNRRRVVAKDELLATLWPEVTVTEASLQRVVSVARSALNDRSQALIRTVSGYGYQFCGNVQVTGVEDKGQAVRQSSGGAASQPQTLFVQTSDGIRIAWWTLGNGSPLVYVPNLIWSHGELEWHMPEIRLWYQKLSSDRNLVRFDPRGTGSSQRRLTDYSIEAIQRDLEAVVDRGGLETFSLFGDLNAGSVAIRYAAEHPERVSRLILWHAFARTRDIQSPHLRMLESLQPLMSEDWETYTETRAHMGFGWSDGDSAHRYAKLMRECIDPDVALQSYEAGRRDDVTALLPKVSARTLVLHRRQFYFWGVDVSQDLAARIPDGRVVVVDGAGSAPFLGDADMVVRAVGDFLAE